MELEHDIKRIQRIIFGDATPSPAVLPAWKRVALRLNDVKYHIDCGRLANTERRKAADEKARPIHAAVEKEIVALRGLGRGNHGIKKAARNRVAVERGLTYDQVKDAHLRIAKLDRSTK